MKQSIWIARLQCYLVSFPAGIIQAKESSDKMCRMGFIGPHSRFASLVQLDFQLEDESISELLPSLHLSQCAHFNTDCYAPVLWKILKVIFLPNPKC